MKIALSPAFYTNWAIYNENTTFSSHSIRAHNVYSTSGGGWHSGLQMTDTFRGIKSHLDNLNVSGQRAFLLIGTSLVTDLWSDQNTNYCQNVIPLKLVHVVFCYAAADTSNQPTDLSLHCNPQFPTKKAPHLCSYRLILRYGTKKGEITISGTSGWSGVTSIFCDSTRKVNEQRGKRWFPT